MDFDKELGSLVETSDSSFTLKHRVHGAHYHSTAGANHEARALYIESSGFLERLEESVPISILDVGLGLGYNALMSIAAWSCADKPGELRIISLESDYKLIEALLSGTAPWMTGWPDKFRDWTKCAKTSGGVIIHPKNGAIRCSWQIRLGDAQQTILAGDAKPGYDFIWHDPFAIDVNPTLWTKLWFEKVLTKASSDAVLMTYSVARAVRDSLKEAGWEVFKIPGSGYKRNWLKARVDPNGL